MHRAFHSRALQPAGLATLLIATALAGTHLASARPPDAHNAAPIGPMPLSPPGEMIAPESDAQPTSAPSETNARTETSAPVVSVSVARETSGGLHVLMIGNSYTMHHTLHVMLQRVAAGVPGGTPLIVDAEAHGGYSLRNHLHNGQALARIRNGHYTHVVLQGHSLSAIDHPDQLAADAERFKQAIDASSARTVFYETWARSPEARLYATSKIAHSFAEMTSLVDAAYFGLSQRLGAGIAPVGRAFERALVQHPNLALWGSDGSHPTVAGSYMAACVLYGALTGADPRASAYVPNELSSADAAQIREIAAESLQEIKTPAPLIAASASLL
ncbi:MAG TPA: DUF4886 domain-containing protein [Polyangiales bacterium]|jgi:hypothetical protein